MLIIQIGSIFGVGVLTGIGFTMSLFVGNLLSTIWNIWMVLNWCVNCHYYPLYLVTS